MDIGIISEGVTDQIIIEAMVQGHLESKDIILDALQPKKSQPGGWPLVIQYCKSKDFRESFPYRDGFTIIHIDCDVFKGADIPADCVMQFNNLNTEETFAMVRNKLIEFLGVAGIDDISNKIVFAIAVDSTECWILPHYFPTKKAKANKISGCIDTLNEVLITAEGFYLDAKDPENYHMIAKHFTKKKNIKVCYKMNESLRLFIDNLDEAVAAYNP